MVYVTVSLLPFPLQIFGKYLDYAVFISLTIPGDINFPQVLNSQEYKIIIKVVMYTHLFQSFMMQPID